MDRNELKVQALLEKVSRLTTSYENDNADLRVELTLVTSDRDRLQAELEQLKAVAAAEDASAEQEEG